MKYIFSAIKETIIAGTITAGFYFGGGWESMAMFLVWMCFAFAFFILLFLSKIIETADEEYLSKFKPRPKWVIRYSLIITLVACLILAYLNVLGFAAITIATWFMEEVIKASLEQEYTKRINNKFEGI